MSHDKTIREQKEAFAILEDKIIKQQEEIERLRYNYSRMQQSVDQILGFLRSKENK